MTDSPANNTSTRGRLFGLGNSIGQKFLQRHFAIEPPELQSALTSFVCAFAMFASYSLLRPIRDAMGISSGWNTLPTLFWAVFFCMLAIQPIYGWVISRYRRSQALHWVYVFFAANLLGFYGWFLLSTDYTWIARVFFVWLSVFNLFVLAVFWSLMTDVFTHEQSARLFGFIMAGISLGGLAGPLLASWLAQPLGTPNLLLFSAALLLGAGQMMRRLAKGNSAMSAALTVASDQTTAKPDVALQGSAWGAFGQLLRSPYLIAIALFVLLSAWVNTVLYLEQQRQVALVFMDADARTAFFARIDAWVQFAALVGQLLLFSKLQRRLGFQWTLALVPLLMVAAFGIMILVPTFATLIAANVLRRVGEFAMVRPSREMLYTIVSRQEKYKAKSLIDTFVFRGGDATSASLLALLSAVSTLGAATTAGISGLFVSLAWLLAAIWLGRRFVQGREAKSAKP